VLKWSPLSYIANVKSPIRKEEDQRLQAQAQLIPEICPISFKELLLVRWLKFTF
jgi:hypothetical protein